MGTRLLVLGWGGEPVSEALRQLQRRLPPAAPVEFLDGGLMAPSLLPHMERRSHVLLLACFPFGGRPSDLYCLRAADLEKWTHLSALHEALRELEIIDNLPREFQAIVAEPSPEAARTLCEAGFRQLARWLPESAPARRAAAAAG
jgi:Ni,Fe-hydrogenase maturation factor